MKYNEIELIEMSPENWDGNTREMLVWNDCDAKPRLAVVCGFTLKGNPIADIGNYKKENAHSNHVVFQHCAEMPKEPETGNVEGLQRSLKQAFNALDLQNKQIEKIKAENDELKANIKSLKDERIKMADSVSSAVWNELMNRAKNIEGPVNTSMAGFGFNDISDIVLNKIIDYKPEKKLRRMTYKELDEWLEQGKGVVRIADVVKNTITYDCESRNQEVYGGYKICGYDEDTWHYPMIEV